MGFSMLPIFSIILILIFTKNFVDFSIGYIVPFATVAFIQFKILKQMGYGNLKIQEKLQAIKPNTKSIDPLKQE